MARLEQHGGSAGQGQMTLSTKVTVIVFWGLIVVGVLVTLFLVNEKRESSLYERHREADAHAFEFQRLLIDNDGDFARAAAAFRERHRLDARQRIVRVHGQKGELLEIGRIDDAGKGDVVTRRIPVPGADGSEEYRLEIVFPPLDAEIHAERTRLLLTLGMLLLVMGFFLKYVLEHVLTRPIMKMAEIANRISEGDSELRFDDTRDDEFGRLANFMNVAVARLKSAQEEAQNALELAQVTLESIADGVITTDARGRIRFVNPVAERFLGKPAEALRGRRLCECLHLIDEYNREEVTLPLEECLRHRRVIDGDSHYSLMPGDGRRISVVYSIAPIHGNGEAVHGAVMIMHDISEEKALQEELSFQASHDPLTGFYNRREFDRELQRCLERAQRDGVRHTLCYIDLDQFKVINDTCGHAAGDDFLRGLAAHLVQKVRRADFLARLGGDEFAIILNFCPLEQAERVAEGLLEAIQSYRFHWNGKVFQASASIGLAPIEGEGTSQEVLAAADMACYAAKEAGRNRVMLYRSDDEQLLRRRSEMAMLTRIREALANGRFELFLQPIVPADTPGRREHYEVLVRMRDEEGDLVSPGCFIPAAERYQLMSEIDRWVIEAALSLLARVGKARPGTGFSINLSGQSMGSEDLECFVRECIDRHGVDPARITFEITETAAINNLAKAKRFIGEIRRLGCRFALDDFGTGVSSYAYLKGLAVDFLKIDGSFIRNIDTDPVDRVMVRSVNEVAHALGIRTIAEFVENESALVALRALGVDFVQGYLVAPPRPASELFRAQGRTASVIPLTGRGC